MPGESCQKLGMAKAQDSFCFQWARARTSEPGGGEAERANKTAKEDRWAGETSLLSLDICSHRT